MAPRAIRQLLTPAMLCVLARPAVAGGLAGPSNDQMILILASAVAIGAFAILALVRGLVRRIGRPKPEPPVPIARVVNESRGGPDA